MFALRLLPGAALLAATSAFAADTTPPVNSLFVSAMAGFNGLDASRDSTGAAGLQDDTNLTFGLGYRFTDALSAELSGGRTASQVDVTGGADVDVDTIKADALWHFARDGRWQPYVAAGLGQQTFDAGVTEVDETIANLGVGVFRNLFSSLNFRADARSVYSFDEDATDYLVSAGLALTFGGSQAQPAAAEPAPVAAAEPAPAPQPAPAPIIVAPVDTDGDGVVDADDKCPDSRPKAKVDATGCALKLKETVTQRLNVQFATGSTKVDAAYDAEIGKLATFLNEYTETNVVIEGHTDNTGRADSNRKLSQARAEAVRQRLVEKFGIDAARVTAQGYGPDKPVADNGSAEGRAQNRRVEAVVSQQVEKTVQ